MKKVAMIFAAVLLAAAVTATPAHAKKIRVIASIFPIEDWVQEVGGKQVYVTVLVPPGASPHTFDPPVSKVKEAAKADIYFGVGAGLEPWADRLVKAAGGSKLKMVSLSDGMKLIQGDEKGEVGNPHVWLDPSLARDMVFKIAKVLGEANPEKAGLFQSRASAYSAQLYKMDVFYKNSIANFRVKKYVTYHPAFAYFGRRYGLECVGVIENKPGMNPTQKQLIDLVEAIKKYKIQAVFVEPQLNPKAAEVIAREAHVIVVQLDPIGGEDKDRDSYLKLMDYNFRILSNTMK